jgi:hypothetical protein
MRTFILVMVAISQGVLGLAFWWAYHSRTVTAWFFGVLVFLSIFGAGYFSAYWVMK